MIRRVQSSVGDGPLLVTEAKTLLEATAMHVLEEAGFSIPPMPGFNQVLYLARERIDLLPEKVDASSEAGQLLRRIYDALWRLASAVNELRNREGIDHGRTQMPQLDGEAGRVVVQAQHLARSQEPADEPQDGHAESPLHPTPTVAPSPHHRPPPSEHPESPQSSNTGRFCKGPVGLPRDRERVRGYRYRPVT